MARSIGDVGRGEKARVKVFVSYSRQDTEFVTRLDRELSGLGHDVWTDTKDIFEGGQDRWRRSIVAAIRDSDVMVLVLSPNSTHSENVERELSVAAENAKRVIPVVYRECELPDGFQYELAGVQHIDFSKSEFKQGVRQLAAYLVSPHHEGSSEVGPAVPASVAGATAGNRERRSRGLVIAGVSLAVLLIGGIVVAATTGGGGSTVASPLTSSLTSSSITSSPVVAVTTQPPSPTIVVVASEALPLPADANSAFCVRADIDFAALRAAADVSSALLAQIPAGSCGSILLDIATTGAGNIDWYHVQFDGVDGWTATTNVMARCVRADIDFSALRADTDLASAMLAQIPAGACDVLLVEPEPASVGGIVWLHVLWNGQRGWTAESNMQ